MPTFADELAFARDLAIRAGEVVLGHFGTGFAVQMKGWADPVTVADRESEALIRGALSRRFPNDGLDGEEEGRRPGSSGRVWLIDPLDGTADFAGGLPIFAVVLTLVDAADPTVAFLNVTYDPVRRETFHAVKGEGAYLDGQPIRVASSEDLAGALVHLHFSNQRNVWETSMELTRRVTAVAPHARNLGSSALAQAYVAAGRLDGHVKVTSGAYDIVGGNLLTGEAGGVVSDLNGAPWTFRGSLLAASAALHPKLLDLTRGLSPT
ncbi:MAG: inositol monophosphatase family protein [Candidatus Dormibacteraceae bacterium]